MAVSIGHDYNGRKRLGNRSLFSYIVTVDDGAAPHVDELGSYLTLAICKPKIRSVADAGDWIMGVGGKLLSRACGKEVVDKVIYLAEITKKIQYDSYYVDPRFRSRVDKIYHRDKTGLWIQDKNPYHGIESMLRDTQAPYVLVCNRFIYFGADGPQIRADCLALVKRNQGHKRIPLSDWRVHKLIRLLQAKYERSWGRYHPPSRQRVRDKEHSSCNRKTRPTNQSLTGAV
jgi:hypothetical protein